MQGYNVVNFLDRDKKSLDNTLYGYVCYGRTFDVYRMEIYKNPKLGYLRSYHYITDSDKPNLENIKKVLKLYKKAGFLKNVGYGVVDMKSEYSGCNKERTVPTSDVGEDLLYIDFDIDKITAGQMFVSGVLVRNLFYYTFLAKSILKYAKKFPRASYVKKFFYPLYTVRGGSNALQAHSFCRMVGQTSRVTHSVSNLSYSEVQITTSNLLKKMAQTKLLKDSTSYYAYNDSGSRACLSWCDVIFKKTNTVCRFEDGESSQNLNAKHLENLDELFSGNFKNLKGT